MLERVEKRHIERKGLVPGPAERPRPDQPPGTDLIPKIKHIVVLMMENHSYDNYLGMLKDRGDGFPLGVDGEPEVANSDADGEPVRAHHLTSTVQRPQVPSQSWHATHHQWGHGKHDGFVTAANAPDGGALMRIGFGPATAPADDPALDAVSS